MYPILFFFLLTSFVSSLSVSRVQNATLVKNDNAQQGLLPLRRRAIKPSKRRFGKREDLTVNLTQANGNQEFVAQVAFGTSSTTLQTFELPIDTASSDTWVVGNNFLCEDFVEYCDPGPRYRPSASFVPLNASLIDEYGDGWILGQFGTETLTIAGNPKHDYTQNKCSLFVIGFAIPNAIIGVVSEGQWAFNGDTSGLLGLGGSMLANLWYTNTPDPRHYQPLLYQMISQDIVAPNVTLGLTQTGGYLGFSGIVPDIPHNGQWITTPMPASSNDPQNDIAYGYYQINVESIDFYASKSIRIKYPYRNFMIVDSGTSANIFPDHIANAINEIWEPQPNPFDGSMPCKVSEFIRVPQLGITINNYTFWQDPQTLFSRYSNGQCASAIFGSGMGVVKSTIILGTPFLMNVIAIFDIKNQVMRLTSTNPSQV